MAANKPAIRVLIAGRRGRGKDTLAAMLMKRIPGMQQIAFADALKNQVAAFTYDVLTNHRGWCDTTMARVLAEERLLDMCWEHSDFPPASAPSPTSHDWQRWTLKHKELFGPLWQAWGEFRRRYDGADFWINVVEERLPLYPRLVIADCRHHNEIEFGRRHGFYIVRVVGPCRVCDGRDDNHESERYVDDLTADQIIDNSSTIYDLDGRAAELSAKLLANGGR